MIRKGELAGVLLIKVPAIFHGLAEGEQAGVTD